MAACRPAGGEAGRLPTLSSVFSNMYQQTAPWPFCSGAARCTVGNSHAVRACRAVGELSTGPSAKRGAGAGTAAVLLSGRLRAPGIVLVPQGREHRSAAHSGDPRTFQSRCAGRLVQTASAAPGYRGRQRARRHRLGARRCRPAGPPLAGCLQAAAEPVHAHALGSSLPTSSRCTEPATGVQAPRDRRQPGAQCRPCHLSCDARRNTELDVNGINGRGCRGSGTSGRRRWR
jgi:hypothetical protein